MKAVSPAFVRALRGTHPYVSRVTLCETFQTGVQPTGTRLPLRDGDVTLDSRADVRSSCDVTVNGTWPATPTTLQLAPFGNEIFIERGIRYTDDLVEYVPLGYFRIDTLDQDNPDSGIIRITGYDRMQAIIEARVLVPRQYIATTPFGDIVDDLVLEIYPDAVIEWDDDTDTALLTRDVIVDDDRHKFLNDAITAQGKIWYWDHRGVLVIKDVPDASIPVYEVTHGAYGVLASIQRTLSRAGVYNAWVVVGEGADDLAPARGVAIDDDPDSHTYFYGRFGQVPTFYSSSFITTDAQALVVANSFKAKKLGLPYDLNFGTIVNPALEPYDPVKVKYSHNEAWQLHVLDTVTIPLSGGASLTSKTRTKQVTFD